MSEDQGTEQARDEAKPARAARGAPKWETDARERLRAAIRRYSKPLADLVARDANEGDTRLLVTDFLCDGLGYDKYAELSTEKMVRGEFADYAVRLDKQTVAFIEVKRAATKLAEKHLRQVEMYAVNDGVEWMILTNGAVWQVYHLEVAAKPATIDLVIAADLLGADTPAAKTAALFPITREGMKRDVIDEVWRARRATSPASLAAVILSEPVTTVIRRELRRQTGHQIDPDELTRLLRETVLKGCD